MIYFLQGNFPPAGGRLITVGTPGLGVRHPHGSAQANFPSGRFPSGRFPIQLADAQTGRPYSKSFQNYSIYRKNKKSPSTFHRNYNHHYNSVLRVEGRMEGLLPPIIHLYTTTWMNGGRMEGEILKSPNNR
jgi:hypothetical protein